MNKGLLIDLLVTSIDMITPSKLSKEKIEESIELAPTSRTMMFNMGLIITGILGSITPWVQSHVSGWVFGVFTTIVGAVGMYFRTTTVTPKGVLGLDEKDKGTDNEKS